jgi:hypothetical protein
VVYFKTLLFPQNPDPPVNPLLESVLLESVLLRDHSSKPIAMPPSKFPLKTASYEQFFKTFSKRQGEKAYLEAKSLFHTDPIGNKDKILALSRYILSSQDPEYVYRFAKNFHNFVDSHTCVEKIIESGDVKCCYLAARDIPNLSTLEINELLEVILSADPNDRKILKVSCTWSEIAKYAAFFLRDVPTTNINPCLTKINEALSANPSVSTDDVVQTLICLGRLSTVNRDFVVHHTLNMTPKVMIAIARRLDFAVEPVALALMAKPNGREFLFELLKGKGPRKLRGLLRQDILDRISTYEVVNA